MPTCWCSEVNVDILLGSTGLWLYTHKSPTQQVVYLA